MNYWLIDFDWYFLGWVFIKYIFGTSLIILTDDMFYEVLVFKFVLRYVIK